MWKKSFSHAEVSRAEGRRKGINSFGIVITRELEVLALLKGGGGVLRIKCLSFERRGPKSFTLS